MEPPRSLHFVPLLLLFLVRPGFPAAAPPATAFQSLFVRHKCSATLYPKPCYQNLLRHAARIRGDLQLMVLAAMGLSTSRIQSALHYINGTATATASGRGSRLAGASDCMETLEEAIDLLRQSVVEMPSVARALAGKAFHVSNVQTWVSAAEENVNTCTDELSQAPAAEAAEAAEGGRRKTACKMAETSMKLTSVALALFNQYANITNP